MADITNKKARYGFLLIERVGDVRIKHFRKSSARMLSVAEARIRDLARSQKWDGTRVFEIWDGINPISVTTVEKTEIGVKYSKKDYLLPVFNGSFTTSKGEKVRICDTLGHEKDYRESHRHERTITCGAKAGDLNSWTVGKPLDRVLCKMVDTRNYTLSTRITKREFC